MKKLLLMFIIVLFTIPAFAQGLTSVCQKINELNNHLLNGTIKRADAAREFKSLIKIIRGNRPMVAGHPWIFPLQGYKSNAIGGINGNGYSDKGYNYLDGNKHSAHPALYFY